MPGESDQAVGFLLEFRNDASKDLQQAVADFDSATEALERAVDAAQAAFVFLEEGSGSMASSIGGAVDSVVRKTDELKGAMQGMGSIEVDSPNLDPVTQALEQFGDMVEAPLDPGFEEVADDLNELEIKAPSMTDFIAWQLVMGTPTKVAPVEATEYHDSLDQIEEAAEEFGQTALPVLNEFDRAIDRTGIRLREQILPTMVEFGEAGEKAANTIAKDAVRGYDRLTQSATRFLQENTDALSEANDVAGIWEGFLKTESGDLRKVQDLLRIADKVDLQPLVENLVDQFGDAALSEAFWGPIAANKAVDQEFFLELRKQFITEKKMYRTWWDRMSDTSKKFFWPVFEKQGEKAAEGIGSVLVSKLKAAFSSPIGQFAAVLTLANILTKVFGPVIEELTTIISQFLMPVIRVLMDLLDAIRPIIMALRDALKPLLRAFSEVFRSLAEALQPAMEAITTLFQAFIPLIVLVAQILAGALGVVILIVSESLLMIANVLAWVINLFGDLLAVVVAVVKPIIDLAVWLGKVTGISKVLGVVLSIFLLPILWNMAATIIPQMIVGVWKLVSAEKGLIASTWKYIAAATKSTWTLVANSASKVWNTAVTWLNSESTIAETIAKGWNTVATWAQTAAQWALNAALLANPITWIVLAVVAAVALLIGIVWLLWKPITAVFGWLGDFFGGLVDGIKQAVDWFGGLGNIILVALGPIGWMILAVRKLIDVFEWLFGSNEEAAEGFSLGFITDGVQMVTDFLFGWVDFIPGWMKWLLGIDEAKVEQQEMNTDAAAEAVGNFEAGAQAEVDSADDWFRSMLGVEAAADDVAVAAEESYRAAGEGAGSALEETVADATAGAEDAAGSEERDAMSSLFGSGDMDLMGMIFDVGLFAGAFMLEGMASGLFMIAQAFPLSQIFGLMFGPFSNVLAQPATTHAKPPVVMSVMIEQVQYEVDETLSNSEVTGPIVAALEKQTDRITKAVAAASANDLNTDLSDLKDIAEF